MLITSVELTNIKSYAHEMVRFAPGTNAICGANGAGKSTILEAIGWALFDTLPYTQQQFFREGEKSGKVIIGLISSADEREYEVERQCGSGSAYFVFDPEAGLRLAEGKEAVLRWLHEHLGLEEAVDLPAMFEDTVGVPQGLLTTAFLLTSRERKGKFDRLLRVEEYAVCYERLRDTRSYLNERAAGVAQRVARLEGETRDLPEFEQGLVRAQADLRDVTAALAALDAQKAGLELRNRAFEAAQARLDELKREREALAMELGFLGKQVVEAMRERDQAERAQAMLRENEAGQAAYGQAETVLRALDARRQERDALLARAAECDKSLAGVAQVCAGIEERLRELAAAEQRAADLAPRVAEQERLEAALKAAEQSVNELAALEKEMVRLSEQSDKLDALARSIAAIEALAETAAGVRALETQHTDCMKRNAALRAEVEAARASLKQVAGGQCPFLGSACLNVAREGTDLEGFFKERVAQLSAQVNTGLQQFADVDKRLKEARQADREVARLDDLRAQHARLEADAMRLAECHARALLLGNAPAQRDEARGQLAALADPRTRRQATLNLAQERPRLEGELARRRQGLAALESQRAGLTAQLAAFATLDAELKAAGEELRRHEPAHRLYLGNQALAATFEARQQAVTGLARREALARERLRGLDETLGEAARAYDAAGHADAKGALLKLRVDLGVREHARRTAESQLSALTDAVTRLRSGRDELAERRAEHAELRGLTDTLEFLRGIIRAAGPYITESLLDSISQEATDIYAEVADDRALQLAWTGDYDIQLRQGAQTRSFKQLSGGEQMSAALAVRLSLLKQLSEIDVAFFDEPTTNLDEDRRTNLAEQIRRIKGFSQLFIITHDNTLEEAAQNVVHIEKVNGASRAFD